MVIPANLKRPINIEGIRKFRDWANGQYTEMLKEYRVMIGLHDFVEYRRAWNHLDMLLGELPEKAIINGRTWAEYKAEYDRMENVISNVYEKIDIAYLSDAKGNDFAVPREIYNKMSIFDDVLHMAFRNVEEEQNLLSEEKTEKLNRKLEEGGFTTRAIAGQKIAKFIGKLCKETKLNKIVDRQVVEWRDRDGNLHEREKDLGYNYHFALLGDSINPLYYTREIVISVNPIDFWTMSFGYKWASCHTIDKNNTRGNGSDNYSGCYSGGTESYMLDESSLIVYVRPTQEELESIGEENLPMEIQSKFKRCIFYLGEDKLVQSRMYPDGRDGGDMGLAAQIRNILQKEIADLLDTSNMWTLKKGTDACTSVIETAYMAPHYRDYSHYSDCNVSFLRRINGDLNHNLIKVGSSIICPECGERHTTEEWITCESCRNEYYATCDRCGDGIRETDEYIYTSDGNYYCCASCAEDDGYRYCEDTEEWEEGWIYDDYNGYYYHDDSEAEYINDYTYVNAEHAEADGWIWSDIDDEWARECDIAIDEGSNEYFITSRHEYIETADGKYYLSEEEAENDGYTINEDGEWIIAA